MANQAVALLVHRDVFQVNALIEMLQSDFDVYVHIDGKSDINVSGIKGENVWKEFAVHWGGFGMIEATMFLYRKILESNRLYSHVILLSGDSLPVKTNNYITAYLDGHAGESFLENLPAQQLHLDRRRFIWHRMDFRSNLRGIRKLQNPFKVIRWLQKKLGLTRSTKGFERTGSQWTILSLAHIRHLLGHCRLAAYRFTAVPDESFIQNHFYNFEIPHRNNLIYAHWPEKRSYSPDIIERSAFDKLVKSPYLFARKFEAGTLWRPAENATYDSLQQ